MCVQKHTCVCPQQQLQPSIDFFWQHTCVCLHSSNWPAKVLNVQNLHLASSLGYSATHMCVFTAALGRPSLKLSSSATHVRVCVYSSNWSAKVSKRIKASIDLFCTGHVCIQKHTCVCPQAAIGRLPFATLNGLLLKHTWLCAHSNWSAEVVGCSEPSLGPQLTSSATHVCLCSQQLSVSFN